MATSASGVPGSYSGRIGNIVYYKLNGKWVARSINKSNKPLSPATLAANQRISVTSRTMKILKAFIEVGFKESGIKKRDNAYNAAMSYNMKNVLQGEYPYINMDYSQMRVSEGDLMPAQLASVEQVLDGLRFSWFTDPATPWPDYTDQVMLLSFFPALGKIVYQLYGPERSVGSATLSLSAPMQTEYMETYISFISADRSKTANSVYTGNFNPVI